MRWPVAAWLVVIGIILFVRFPVKFLLDPPFLMDFDLFHTLARRLASGDAAQLYAPAGSVQSVFKYAPVWGLALWPFGWLPAHPSAVLWSSLTVLWCLVTLWLAHRLCRNAGAMPAGWLLWVPPLVLIRPLTSEFLLGQTNLLWGGLATASVFFALTRRTWWSAGCLALAISLKLPAVVFVVYLALRKDWRAVACTGLCFAVSNLLAAWLLAPHDPLSLFRQWSEVLMTSGPGRAFEIGNQSFLALMGRLLRADGYGLNLLALPDGAVTVIAGLLQGALFLTLWWSSTTPRSPAQRTIVDGALLTIWMVLFSPTCWIATYAALMFPLMLAAAFLTTSSPQRWGWPAATGALAVGLFSLMTHGKFWRLAQLRALRGESYVYLVLMILPLLGLSLAWLLLAQRAALARQSPSRAPAGA